MKEGQEISSTPTASRMPRWLRIGLKIVLGGLAVLLTLLLVGLLSFDWIVKRTIQSQINASGVAEVEIGSLNIGLLRPFLEVRDLKVYGQSQFGGVQLLDMPELRVEYDREALNRQELKLRLVRIRLNELTLMDGFAALSSAAEQLTATAPSSCAAVCGAAAATRRGAGELSQRYTSFAAVTFLTSSITRASLLSRASISSAASIFGVWPHVIIICHMVQWRVLCAKEFLHPLNCHCVVWVLFFELLQQAHRVFCRFRARILKFSVLLVRRRCVRCARCVFPMRRRSFKRR